jgi:tetratricopeptide (TPR) repeat protein
MKPVNNKFTSKHQLILLVFILIGLNLNTLFNDYAVDDGVVIAENNSVQKGFTAIKEIFSNDYFYGYREKESFSKLNNGRYRPLTLLTFAFEYQFFGANPFISHAINLLLFTGLIVLLYYLLRKYLFKYYNKHLAFLTCLLFAVHPVHTEVIANVKGRDEILAFIFLIASTISLLKYIESKNVLNVWAGLVFYSLALFSKESAIVFTVAMPLMFYFFSDSKKKQIVYLFVSLAALSFTYLLIRKSIIYNGEIIASNILNSPYLLASFNQALATKVYIIIRYIILLIIPYPLSSDYGFKTFEYLELSSLNFIISSIILLLLIVSSFIFFKTKNIYAFCIIFFFISISIASNFIANTGTFMAERMLFIPSLSFCIAIAYYLLYLSNKRQKLSISFIFIYLLFFSITTYSRNSDWKNNSTLYLSDVKTSTNSIRINQYAAEWLIIKGNQEDNTSLRNRYYYQAIEYCKKLLKFYPDYPPAYMDLGGAYFGLKDYIMSADNFKMASVLIPLNTALNERLNLVSRLLTENGKKEFTNGNLSEAEIYLQKALTIDSINEEAIEYLRIIDQINSGNVN